MPVDSFVTVGGREVPAVTAEDMRAVDRVAVEEVGLEILQMMENAGRTLAWHVQDVRNGETVVWIVAGNGGNGGGGMACARHLANRDTPVRILLDRPAEKLNGPAGHQLNILSEMAVPITTEVDALFDTDDSIIVVDALIGYGLSGELRAPASRYVEVMNLRSDSIVSLDVPSGTDATSGEPLGVAVRPTRTVTLALPKTGLDGVEGHLFLADIGIPATVYDRLDIDYENAFGENTWVRLA